MKHIKIQIEESFSNLSIRLTLMDTKNKCELDNEVYFVSGMHDKRFLINDYKKLLLEEGVI